MDETCFTDRRFCRFVPCSRREGCFRSKVLDDATLYFSTSSESTGIFDEFLIAVQFRLYFNIHPSGNRSAENAMKSEHATNETIPADPRETVIAQKQFKGVLTAPIISYRFVRCRFAVNGKLNDLINRTDSTLIGCMTAIRKLHKCIHDSRD